MSKTPGLDEAPELDSSGVPIYLDELEPARLSGAELRVWLDWLGLTAKDAAALLKVRGDTMRRWIAERERVPVRIGEELEALDQMTATAVGMVVDSLRDARDPGVVIYRTDEELWREHPEAHPYPATWWRMVVARATAEIPGVEIVYFGDPRSVPRPNDRAGNADEAVDL